MKTVILLLIGLLLFIPLVSAHAIDKGPISKSTEEYVIEFSTIPKFPVTGKQVHLDFVIKDQNENFITESNVKIELHKEEKIITLDLAEEKHGHYSVGYEYGEAGEYEIHPIINGDELETGFELTVDGFGLSGLLRAGTIILLLLILIGFMIKDCRRNKIG